MTVESRTTTPPWLATVLRAEDDTEESVMGSDWHMKAIVEAFNPLLTHAEEREAAQAPPWYVSSQITVIVPLPRRIRPWHPKPDLVVVVGLPANDRTSYDTRREGPMPQFVLEVASESTWRDDVEEKRDLYFLVGVQEYVVFDPTGEFLPERIRAWHTGEDGRQPWAPVVDAEGHAVWRSAVLGLSLRVERPLLRFDHPVSGPLLARREQVLRIRTSEQDRQAAERRAEVSERQRQAAEQARQAAERRAEISEQQRESEKQARQAAEQALRDLRRELDQ
jgi:Uma2 family endonuclease